MSTQSAEPQFVGTAPYFVVQNLLKAIDYYHKVLGFTYPPLWGEPPTFGMPSRDGFILMLKEAEPDRPIVPNRQQGGYWDAYIWIKDADALFNEMKNNGAIIDYEPVLRQDYGMKEFAVRDLDGYVIAFGQSIEGA